MKTRRYVRQNAEGTWEVLEEGHHRSAVTSPTKAAAVARARSAVRRAGGGEIRVMDHVGKIVSADTVAAERRTARTPSSRAAAKG